MTGTLQFWNVTIDTASSILIILSVGLAVDYSAHIGHTFMTISGDREGLYYYVITDHSVEITLFMLYSSHHPKINNLCASPQGVARLTADPGIASLKSGLAL